MPMTLHNSRDICCGPDHSTGVTGNQAPRRSHGSALLCPHPVLDMVVAVSLMTRASSSQVPRQSAVTAVHCCCARASHVACISRQKKFDKQFSPRGPARSEFLSVYTEEGLHSMASRGETQGARPDYKMLNIIGILLHNTTLN